ncbi:MAG: hypothetical protein HP006_06860 [Alistipes sp.]|nr:hypothetical protein [Alistipes sp.]
MSQFNYRQAAKIITWETSEFSIEADTQEEADRIARTITRYDIAERNGVTLGNTTTDCNSNQLIPPEQNGGVPTLQLFNDDTNELLADNIPKPVADEDGKIRAIGIFGKMAISQYEQTGIIPSNDQEWYDGSVIVTKEFDSRALYDIYVSALDDSDGTDDWRLIRQP